MKTRNLAAVISASLLFGTFAFTEISVSKPRTYVVAMVKTTGGFVPPAYNFTRVPNFVIYSDGRMISFEDVSSEIYPSPVLPVFRTKFVNSDMTRILSALQASKLTDSKFEWGYPGVADVPNTEVLTQLSAQKQSSLVSVYALSFSGPGVTKEQSTYRKKASRLLTDLQGFSNKYIWTKSMPTTWIPSQYAYLASPAEPTSFSVIRKWNGPKLSAESKCAILSPSDSAPITKLGRAINNESLWSSGGKNWRVSFRPLLPHESNCKSIGY